MKECQAPSPRFVNNSCNLIQFLIYFISYYYMLMQLKKCIILVNRIARLDFSWLFYRRLSKIFITKSQFCYRNPENGDIEDMSLEAIFSEDESDADEGDVDVDDSGSDGYLSEVLKPIVCEVFVNVFHLVGFKCWCNCFDDQDSNCLPIAESEIHLGGEDYYLLLFLNYFKYFFSPFHYLLANFVRNLFTENGAATKPSAQNQEILLELENKKKKLSRLKAKVRGFQYTFFEMDLRRLM